jgi:hypothetical protein
MIPFYLLEMESNRYPTYIDNSNLNANLSKTYKLARLTIHITDTVLKELQSHNMDRSIVPQQPTAQKVSQVVLTEISLLTTAD